jgi:intracellular sulfur oxidation DsrE/DsrF family protein
MNCLEAEQLLHAYLDQELDLVTSLAFEKHLGTCAGCQRKVARQKSVRQAVAQHAHYFRADAAVRKAVCTNIKELACAEESRWWHGWKTTIPTMALAASLAWIALPHFAPHMFESKGSVQEKVVYHIDSTAEASNALRNAMNLLDDTPGAKIIIVAHNEGVDFLMDGAKDKNGQPYRMEVTRLVARGVDFRVCKNTLTRRHVAFSKVIPEAHLVSSGVAEIARLQAKEGYVYLKP